MQDGANEANSYANQHYLPVNPPIEPPKPGNPAIVDLDRWQPIALVQYIDQGGNVINSQPPALTPEWGAVAPFSLTDADKVTNFRDGFGYNVYHDPGAPPRLHGTHADIYKWAFALVAVWSGHLDQTDGVMIDISPASTGNLQSLPASFDEYPGLLRHAQRRRQRPGPRRQPGDWSGLRAADRAARRLHACARRVLGRRSELGDAAGPLVHDPQHRHRSSSFQRKLAGIGGELGPLEWDVKAYFALGGAMHDAAITAWGIKGWYDCIRPISAIRGMADRGQSSDPNAASYDPDGLPLVPGHIELVAAGDPLAGAANENVGKIKLYAWRGPQYIPDPLTTQASAGWILAENWWPYQRPTFVTPPFPGYISGHSTYSRAAAEVLTSLTGSEYFPGGMSGFPIKAHDYLVFEDGPSVDMTLQWATYRDAAEQSALSRIWGGIHPPIDDIPGRLIGIKIGQQAYTFATSYFGN